MTVFFQSLASILFNLLSFMGIMYDFIYMSICFWEFIVLSDPRRVWKIYKYKNLYNNWNILWTHDTVYCVSVYCWYTCLVLLLLLYYSSPVFSWSLCLICYTLASHIFFTGVQSSRVRIRTPPIVFLQYIPLLVLFPAL